MKDDERDADRNPCGALLRVRDARGEEAIFPCYLSPFHRRGHHRAALGDGVRLTWPGNGPLAGQRFPDAPSFFRRLTATA